jgi:hypothetical protein
MLLNIRVLERENIELCDSAQRPMSTAEKPLTTTCLL